MIARSERRRARPRGRRRRAFALAAPLFACAPPAAAHPAAFDPTPPAAAQPATFGPAPGGAAQPTAFGPAPRGAARPSASGAAPLGATRSAGAAACPDAEALGARVRALRPEAAPEALRVDVHFDREGGGYVATVRASGGVGAARVLRAPGPGCEGLADATAVTISLLLDVPPESPPARPPAAPAPGRPPRTPAPSWGAWLAAGGGFGWQLPARAGALVKLEALASPSPSLLVGLGGALAPRRAIERGDGEVDVDLRFAFARACWQWGPRGGVRAGACVVPAAGQLRGRGRGYATDRAVSRAWYALGGGLLASGPLAGPVGWLADASALAPLGRESFSVDELGVVYRTPVVGVATSAAVTVQIR